MTEKPATFGEYLAERKVSRRDLLKFAAAMAAVLALPKPAVQAIAKGLAAATRLPVIWTEFQGCTGDTESFLRSAARPDVLTSSTTDPSVTDLLLDYLSLDYHETIMVAAGDASEKSKNDTLSKYSGQFVYIVEGSIPTAQNGAFCTINGQTALSIVKSVAPKAKAVIALGSCAYDGGLAGAAPNPTGAVGVSQAAPGLTTLINLPGCPANAANLVATLVSYISLGQWPALDSATKRPLFAYGSKIHAKCERRPYYDNGQFVRAWGDAGHKAGYCLYMMGCHGPVTDSNCPIARWNAGSLFPSGTSWPVAAGHGCIGCTNPKFWDASASVYNPV